MRLPSAAVVVTAACLVLSACVTEMVDKKKPRKGPVPEVGYIDTGSGEIRYSAEGWGFVVGQRRSSALRRMRRFCKRDLEPKIVDEFTHDDVETPYSGMDVQDDLPKGVEHYNVAPYHHIMFECVPKTAAVEDIAKAGDKTGAKPGGQKK